MENQNNLPGLQENEYGEVISMNQHASAAFSFNYCESPNVLYTMDIPIQEFEYKNRLNFIAAAEFYSGIPRELFFNSELELEN